MRNSIAIIGVSFDLPNIKSWKDLGMSLYNKDSFIDEMPNDRLSEIQKAFGEIQMARGGYLNRVDQFDNEYFGFTERESLKTFPEHRLFLTNAMKAFYHAGYNEESLKGTKAGIFYTAARSAYHNYASVSNISFGSFDFVQGIEATKLAKYLDLRGPVVSINTSCSSSLVAINSAKQSLNANECDVALVGGVKILALAKEKILDNVVHSKKGTCRPFDADADGMINGEGAIFFVLKHYDKAIKDGDTILGEIRGGAINHGGARISSLTAPSSNAQKEVIIQAWENAGIDPREIRYIEAHGTGTILGDPIEVEGIKQAFFETDSSKEKHPIALSSFKGQIGHLDYLSGLAGLLRLVAALNLKVIPVQPNFNKLNEFFSLEDTGLYIPTSVEDWPAEDGERVGGVSSFGMTGANVHLVVSKKDNQVNVIPSQKEINYLQISQKDNQKLKLYKDYLIEKIKEMNSYEAVNNLCSKLNKIFQIDKENQGIIYTSKKSLIDVLELAKPIRSSEKQFLLLDLDILAYSKEDIESIFIENVFIKKYWDEYVSLELEEVSNQEILSILFQYAIYKYLLSKLGSKISFITPKENSLLNRLVKSEITVRQIIDQTGYKNNSPNTFDEDAFKKYLNKSFKDKKIIVIDFSKKDKNRFDDLNIHLNVIDGSFLEKDRSLLYTHILDLGVNPLKPSLNTISNNVELPYFNLKRFWPEPKVNQLSTNNSTLKKYSVENIQKIISQVWSTVLETEGFKNDDDFFELGGTSLSALDMIDELEKNIEGVKIPYEDIYSYATILGLSKLIFTQLNQEPDIAHSKSDNALELNKNQVEEIIRKVWTSILETDDFGNDDDFFELGGTSLSALDMIDELEKNIKNFKLPYEEIYSYSTITAILNKVLSQQNIEESIEEKTTPVIDLGLRESKYQEVISNVRKENFSKSFPKKIFLTGGTGLLGMTIIDYLINNTNAQLICLVRKKEWDSSAERFWSLFRKYHNVRDESRISIVEGDLYLENLGINYNSKEWKEIDTIFHVAGSPQFISRKTKKEHINFVGTKNIVDWANLNKIGKINFISTIGIVGKSMPPDIENFYETDTDLGQQNGKLIHGASKLFAEEYINKHYHFKSKIFRISNLGGRYKDGCFPTNLNKNLMWSRLKSLSELECYCPEILDQYSGIGFMPVDLIAALLVEISFVDVGALKVFHIPRIKSFSNGEILNALKKTGVKLESTSYDDFMAYLNKNGYKMNFHQVAKKENNFVHRSDATNEVLAKLKLDKIITLDREVYLEMLIRRNLKINKKVVL